MKKLALAAALLMVAGAQPASAAVLEDIANAGRLTCGVLGNNQPYAYQDPATREIVGYEVDLCREVAESLGVELETRVVSGESRVPELMQGRIHLLAARLSYTPARAEQVDFSNTYLVDFLRCFAVDPELDTLDDLADVRIGLTQGSILESIVAERYDNPRVVVYRDAPLLFLSVEQGRVESGCNVTVSIMNYLRRADSDINVIDEPIFLQRIGFAVRKNEPEFLDHVNAVLADLEASGRAQELFDSWIGEPNGVEREFTFTESAQ